MALGRVGRRPADAAARAAQQVRLCAHGYEPGRDGRLPHGDRAGPRGASGLGADTRGRDHLVACRAAAGPVRPHSNVVRRPRARHRAHSLYRVRRAVSAARVQAAPATSSSPLSPCGAASASRACRPRRSGCRCRLAAAPPTRGYSAIVTTPFAPAKSPVPCSRVPAGAPRRAVRSSEPNSARYSNVNDNMPFGSCLPPVALAIEATLERLRAGAVVVGILDRLLERGHGPAAVEAASHLVDNLVLVHHDLLAGQLVGLRAGGHSGSQDGSGDCQKHKSLGPDDLHVMPPI